MLCPLYLISLYSQKYVLEKTCYCHQSEDIYQEKTIFFVLFNNAPLGGLHVSAMSSRAHLLHIGQVLFIPVISPMSINLLLTLHKSLDTIERFFHGGS